MPASPAAPASLIGAMGRKLDPASIVSSLISCQQCLDLEQLPISRALLRSDSSRRPATLDSNFELTISHRLESGPELPARFACLGIDAALINRESLLPHDESAAYHYALNSG